MLALLSLVSVVQVQAQKDMELTATEVAQRMMPGWNLGNTMEGNYSWGDNPAQLFQNNGGLRAETSWQGTMTTQEVIDFVKSQGFRSVRIPCAWVWGHISDATTYTIDSAWMARVKEIVDYCIKSDLYVLLNDHWDGGWLDSNLKATGEQKEKNKTVLAAIWTQIANEFRDYDDHLLFAGQNEPPVPEQADMSALVEYQQAFIDAVRATGGNNEKRLLVVQGPYTDAEKTCDWLTDNMPTDPIGNKLAVEIHFYYPWNFWGMEKDEDWGNMFYYWGNGNHVSGSKHNPTYGEEKDMTALADRLKSCFVDKGIPVINGEYGVMWRTIKGDGESQEKHDASIHDYYKFMNQLCMERGIVPMAWDTNSIGSNQMTIINRKDLTVFNSLMMDGIHEAMEAVGIPVTALKPVYDKASVNDLSLYDLRGRKVQESAVRNGIYIRNGKKMQIQK